MAQGAFQMGLRLVPHCVLDTPQCVSIDFLDVPSLLVLALGVVCDDHGGGPLSFRDLCCAGAGGVGFIIRAGLRLVNGRDTG